jgi:hypothetical protein
MAEKEYKPEPPKPPKDTAVLRFKLDIIERNIKTVLEQVQDMRKSIDQFEEHYKQVLEHPAETEPMPALPPSEHKDEVDDAVDALLNG